MPCRSGRLATRLFNENASIKNPTPTISHAISAAPGDATCASWPVMANSPIRCTMKPPCRSDRTARSPSSCPPCEIPPSKHEGRLRRKTMRPRRPKTTRPVCARAGALHCEFFHATARASHGGASSLAGSRPARTAISRPKRQFGLHGRLSGGSHALKRYKDVYRRVETWCRTADFRHKPALNHR